jgi:hypothetical protein
MQRRVMLCLEAWGKISSRSTAEVPGMLKLKTHAERPPEVISAEDASAHLFALIESTQDLVWSVDLEYRLLTFNKSLADCLLRSYGILASAGSSVHVWLRDVMWVVLG